MDAPRGPDDQCGLLTRTLYPSPAVSHILTARLRSSLHNDVVFVGPTLVQVKRVAANGRLQHVASLPSLAKPVLSAVVIGKSHALSSQLQHHPPQQPPGPAHPLVKHEPGLDGCDHSSPKQDPHPPHAVVLLLEDDQLVFLTMARNPAGHWAFQTSSRPLPRFGHVHLAVDPYSRALVAAAHASRFTFCQLATPLPPAKSADACITAVDAYSARMNVIMVDFVFPDHGHPSILALFVGGDRNTQYAKVFKWESLQDNSWHSYPEHSVRLGQDGGVATLLIPLAHSPGAFVLAFEHHLAVYKNAHIAEISESTRMPNHLPVSRTPGRDAAANPRSPIWVAWARAPRWYQRSEQLYLCKENGLVHSVLVGTQREYHHGETFLPPGPPEFLESSRSADLGGNMGFAFTLYDAQEGDPDAIRPGGDVLLYMGNLCDGAHYEVGARTSDAEVGDLVVDIRDKFHNWAPLVDIAVVPRPDAAAASFRDSVQHFVSPSRLFATSGRGHAGAVSELRYGCEIKTAYVIATEDSFQASNAVWSLCCDELDQQLHVLSMPFQTVFLTQTLSGSFESLEPVHGDDETTIAFDRVYPAPEAGLFLPDAQSSAFFIRVTRDAVSLLQLLTIQGEDDAVEPMLHEVHRWPFPAIQTASVNATPALVSIVAATISGSAVSLHQLAYSNGNFSFTLLGQPHDMPGIHATCSRIFTLDQPSDGLKIKQEDGTLSSPSYLYLALGLAENSMHVLYLSRTDGPKPVVRHSLLSSITGHRDQYRSAGEDADTCESIAIAAGNDRGSKTLACGTRNGLVLLLTVASENHGQATADPALNVVVEFAPSDLFRLGSTPVQLVNDPHHEPGLIAYTGGTELYYFDTSKRASDVERGLFSMWFTDRTDRAMQQPRTNALCHVAGTHARLLSVGDSSLVFGDFHRRAAPLPRSIPVQGSPSRILWSEHAKRLVIASTDNVVDERMRKRHSVGLLTLVDPDRPSSSADDVEEPEDEANGVTVSGTTLTLPETTETIRTIAEWRCHYNGSIRYFLVIGTSCVRSDGREKGFIRMFTYVNDDRGRKVLRLKNSIQENGPIWALTPFDESTLIYCVDTIVYARRVTPEPDSSRLKLTKSEVATLNSKGTYMTSDAHRVYITTGKSSTQVFKFDQGRLRLEASDFEARDGVAHLVLDPTTVMTTDMHGTVTGMRSSNPHQSARRSLVFQARLSVPIYRFARAHIRSLARALQSKARLDQSPAAPDIVGTSPDGSLHQLIPLRSASWRLFRFVQNMALRDSRLYPLQDMRAFGTHIEPNGREHAQRHVNGDLLVRLVSDPEAADLLHQMLRIPPLEDALQLGRRLDFQTADARRDRFVQLVRSVVEEDGWPANHDPEDLDMDLHRAVDIALAAVREVVEFPM